MCMHQDFMCFSTRFHSHSIYSECCFAWLNVFKQSPSHPSLFPLLTQCDGCLPPLSIGAHGAVSRICQPWERSPPRSWLAMADISGTHPPRSDAIVNVILIVIFSEFVYSFCIYESPYTRVYVLRLRTCPLLH